MKRYPEKTCEKGTPVLCYIEGCWAYFTTASLSEQWGDDWNDAPYEHNAEPPRHWAPHYDMEPYDIIRIAFRTYLETPSAEHYNSPYSVEDINAGAVPWLKTPSWEIGPAIEIYAGCSLLDFIGAIKSSDGEIYTKHQ